MLSAFGESILLDTLDFSCKTICL